MNESEILQSLQDGAIETTYAEVLLHFLTQAESLPNPARGIIQGTLAKLSVLQHASYPLGRQDILPSFKNIPGAADRPGIVRLFHATHQEAISSTRDPLQMQRLDTFTQLHSIVRSETQPVLMMAIRELWRHMSPILDEQKFVIPVESSRIRMVRGTKGRNVEGTQVRVIPFQEFADTVGATSSETIKIALRRISIGMAEYLLQWWYQKQGRHLADVQRAELLLQFRDMTFDGPIMNGFGSGFDDVINPLQNIIRDFLDTHREVAAAALRDPAFLKKIAERHLEFSTLYATFNLIVIGRIDDLMYEKPSEDALAFLQTQIDVQRALSAGKDNVKDRHYGRQYFTTRYVDDGGQSGIPVADFAMDTGDECFTEEQIAYASHSSVRLGCPSLGEVHRAFTLKVCDLYFRLVLPALLKEYGY